jgi:adenosylhomocysteine nucleosidase
MDVIVLVSADTEWRAVCSLLPLKSAAETPYGECFRHDRIINGKEVQILFLHGGWGKIAAGASTQYGIDRWQPQLLVNLGTCGGFSGEIERGTVILVERTLVYDIFEQMGDGEAHIGHYATDIDVSFLNYPLPIQVQRELLISGDRDLIPAEIADLKRKYGAIAGDWESGAIAFVARRNSVPLLILRGVSDLVSEKAGEVYGDHAQFEKSAYQIMEQLVNALPGVLGATSFFK